MTVLVWRNHDAYSCAAEHFRWLALEKWGKSLARIADEQENTPTVDVTRFTPLSMLKPEE